MVLLPPLPGGLLLRDAAPVVSLLVLHATGRAAAPTASMATQPRSTMLKIIILGSSKCVRGLLRLRACLPAGLHTACRGRGVGEARTLRWQPAVWPPAASGRRRCCTST